MTREELMRLDDQGMAAWNKHDPAAWAELFGDGFIWHDWTMPEPIRTKEGARQYFAGWMTAFPDMTAKTTNRVIGDDSVAAEIEFTGTNTGPLVMGGKSLPATNKRVVGRGTYMAKARNGKIIEYRTHPDVAGMMMQLGMMPAM